MGAHEVNRFLTEVRVNNSPTSSATARQHHRVWTDVTRMPGVGEENVVLVWKILNGSLKDTWSYIDKTEDQVGVLSPW